MDAAPPAVAAPVTRRFALASGLVLLGLAAVLLFARLGWYPFWGDEADTVIFGQGVWRTGDLDAWYGENLYAYRNGALLEDLRGRAAPPLPYFVAAPFWGLFGADRFAMRLPFALCGLATIGMVLYWAYRRQASRWTYVLLGLGLVLNVSLILYARQCRYFSLGMLLSVVAAYLYDTFDGSWRKLFGLALAMCLLAATHYLNFAAWCAAVVIDFLAWRRRGRLPSLAQCAALIVPVGVVFAGLVYIYNPLGKNAPPGIVEPDTLHDKMKLLGLTFRDINACEYGVGLIMLVAPLVAAWRRRPELSRLFLAGATFIVATTAVSPQPAKGAFDADIRYLAPIVPLCAVLTVLTATTAAGRTAWAAAIVVGAACCSNVLHVPWSRGHWHSTLADWLGELQHPRSVANEELANWLRANAREGETVWIAPNEWCAPQIVAAPHVRYAWQLKDPPRPEGYASLPKWHFFPEFIGERREAADLIIVFGYGNLLERVETELLPALATQSAFYREVAVIDRFFDDRTRPELHWHWFADRPYDKTKHAVYIFRRVEPASTP